MTPEDKLSNMGFKNGIPFNLQELSGTYVLSLEDRTVYEVSNCDTRYKVSGLYENMLLGKYHKSKKG